MTNQQTGIAAEDRERLAHYQKEDIQKNCSCTRCAAIRSILGGYARAVAAYDALADATDRMATALEEIRDADWQEELGDAVERIRRTAARGLGEPGAENATGAQDIAAEEQERDRLLLQHAIGNWAREIVRCGDLIHHAVTGKGLVSEQPAQEPLLEMSEERLYKENVELRTVLNELLCDLERALKSPAYNVSHLLETKYFAAAWNILREQAEIRERREP